MQDTRQNSEQSQKLENNNPDHHAVSVGEYGRDDTAKMSTKDMKRVETMKKRSTCFATIILAFVNITTFFVPDGVRKHINLQRRVFIGALLAFILIGSFWFLFIWYDTCEQFTVLTKNLEEFDESQCTVDTNTIITTLRIDTESRWEVDEAFNPQKALWQVRFLSFGATDIEAFHEFISTLRTQINQFISRAVNLQPFTLLQYLLHSRTLVKGDQGYAQIRSSFGLQSFMSNFDLAQVRFFRSQSLSRCSRNNDNGNDDDNNLNKGCDFNADLKDITTCGKGVTGPFLVYNITRSGQADDYYQLQQSGTQSLLRLNLLKELRNENIVQVFDGQTCTNRTKVSLKDVPLVARELPYFRNCSSCKLMDISFDIALVNALDFCNWNFDVCQAFYKLPENLAGQKVYSQLKQMTQSRFRTSKPQLFDSKQRKFAFTKYELNEEFSIVPEIIQTCPSCLTATNNEIADSAQSDCSKQFDIVLHYYIKKGDRSGDSGRRLLQTPSSEARNVVRLVSSEEDEALEKFLLLESDLNLDNVWYTVKDNITYFYNNVGKNHDNARQFCQQFGADLVYFDSFEEEQSLMFRMRALNEKQSNEYLWTSLANPDANRENYCDEFFWFQESENISLSYQNWQNGECNSVGYIKSEFYGGILLPWQLRIPRSNEDPYWVTLRNSSQNAVLCSAPGTRSSVSSIVQDSVVVSAPLIVPETEALSPVPVPSPPPPTPVVKLHQDVLSHLGFVGDKSYYYSLEQATWTDAQERCFQLGGSLLQLDSQTTENTVNLLLQYNPLFQYSSQYGSDGFVWIGLQYTEEERWKWTSALELNYTNWGPELPADLSSDNCATAFFAFNDGVLSSWWQVLPCSQLSTFICELQIDLVSVLDAIPSPPPLIFSPPPPAEIGLQSSMSPPPPPPPPTQQELTDILVDQLEQVEEEPVETETFFFNADEFDERPELGEAISITTSGYEFKIVPLQEEEVDYKFSLLVSMKSQEPKLSFNQFQTFMPNIYCSGGNLQFEEVNGSLNVPFTLSSNVYECEVEVCRSVLERLATAFASVELFYVIVALIIVLSVMVCCLQFSSGDDEHMTLFESIANIFGSMMEVTEL